ncbi:MAG: division/cell wall cluster transcriptional repressor MraZ [Lachnospiraceae bacterium]|nr:division/cell wall cluster transcriptional repressor MraZ [Lachnospiraceae bacterium]
MFMGEFNHTIDPKNRIIVPAKFRDELGENFVISAGLDGCLYLTKKSSWEAFSQQLSELPFTAETRKLQRHFMRNAQECEPDKQGRILVPQNLKEMAGLDKEVVLLGSGSKVEIWSKERLDAETGDATMEEITESMSQKYGLRFC